MKTFSDDWHAEFQRIRWRAVHEVLRAPAPRPFWPYYLACAAAFIGVCAYLGFIVQIGPVQ